MFAALTNLAVLHHELHGPDLQEGHLPADRPGASLAREAPAA